MDGKVELTEANTFCSPGVLFPYAQALQDFGRSHFPIEGVKVEPMHHSTVQQLPAHGHCQLHPIVPDSCIIVLDGFNHIFDFLRHFQLGELHQLAQRVVTLDEDADCNFSKTLFCHPSNTGT